MFLEYLFQKYVMNVIFFFFSILYGVKFPFYEKEFDIFLKLKIP